MCDQGEPYTVADAARETRDLVYAPGGMANPFGSMDWRFLPTQIKEYDGRALRRICIRLLDSLEVSDQRLDMANCLRTAIHKASNQVAEFCATLLADAEKESTELRALLRQADECMTGHLVGINCHGPSVPEGWRARVDAVMPSAENQEQGEEPDACAADVPGDPGRPAPSTPHPLGD